MGIDDALTGLPGGSAIKTALRRAVVLGDNVVPGIDQLRKNRQILVEGGLRLPKQGQRQILAGGGLRREMVAGQPDLPVEIGFKRGNPAAGNRFGLHLDAIPPCIIGEGFIKAGWLQRVPGHIILLKPGLGLHFSQP